MSCRGTPKSSVFNPRDIAPDIARLAPTAATPPRAVGAISLHHRNIVSARTHAELVDAVEACAPPVLATRLREGIDRAALDVVVRYIDGPLPYFLISDAAFDQVWSVHDPDLARAIYRRVVSQRLTAPISDASCVARHSAGAV